MKTHTEDAFEKLITEHLVLHGGYEPRGQTSYDLDDALAVHAGYDVHRALIPAEVVTFVQATQPKPWAKLQAIHGAALDGIFLDALCKVMDQRGALSVIRQGLKFHGQQIRLAYFAPGHGLNPAVWNLYSQNRLRVVRQLRYDPRNHNELDLVLFLNGLPIATAELKNPITGQKADHARQQYKTDRDPNAPLFRFKARALVHFAVDTDEVWMTTRLRGLSTRFLPFNELLSDSRITAKLEEDGEDLAAPDQLALRAALFRGPQANMSFFAFTATPKYKTLEMFGHTGADGRIPLLSVFVH